MKKLGELYPGKPILNHDFQRGTLRKEFAAQPYTIVHIASHGEFDSDVKKRFVLTFDKNLTLDDLEHCSGPRSSATNRSSCSRSAPARPPRAMIARRSGSPASR